MSSTIPAYIIEAKKKGEKFVPVLIVRFNPETQMHTSIRKEIRTDQAMLIFSKPMQSRKQNEKLVRPIDFSTDAVPAKVDPRKALSQLSDEDLLKAMEERGLAAKPKRGKKEATAETEAPETETPETPEQPEL
jgi:hypothetical protein